MLFDFELTPLFDVTPWGEAPDFRLSWFGFSEGFYRLNVGETRLLSYSDESVARWRREFPNAYPGPMVDYHVVRLWEDMLQILPDVLAPLPDSLARRLKHDPDFWFRWESDGDERASDGDDSGDEVFWRDARRLDCGYLQNAPRIWFWSTPETVFASWDNTAISLAGHPVWEAARGHFSFHRAAFLSEVAAFDEQFLSRMAARIDSVCDAWNRPEIRIDRDGLRREQSDRATWLTHAMNRPPSVAFDNPETLAMIEARIARTDSREEM